MICKMNIISEVKFTKTEIVINFESGKTKTIEAHGDCCSKSYFEQFDTSKLIGKELIDIMKKKNHSSMKVESVTKELTDDFDDKHIIVEEVTTKRYLLVFLLNNNEYVPFHLVNESNGYYDGYVIIR